MSHRQILFWFPRVYVLKCKNKMLCFSVSIFSCQRSSEVYELRKRSYLVAWKVFHITQIYLYNFDPLKHHFYTVKLGFTRVYIIFLFFLISAQKIYCGYSLEPPRWGGSNEYQQSMFWAEIWKYQNFYLKTFSFWWWNVQ